jgi:hypothetical protein
MRFLRTLPLLITAIACPAMGASLFHSYVADLSPPYICKLKLKDAQGVSINTRHTYQFSGICSIKIPVGNTWIYQNVWVDTQGTWDGTTNDATEITTLANDMGTVTAQLKCDDDPWLTKSQCSLLNYQNSTQFTNLSGVFNPRTGEYPTFETISGQFPPLARNQAILREAIVLSVISAKREAAQAHAAFNQTFNAQPSQSTQTATAAIPAAVTPKPVHHTTTHIFYKPKVGNLRLDVCLKLNQDCGQPAADRFCQSMGYHHSLNCKLDNERSTPTFIIGTQTICNQTFCKGFEMIECVK